MAGRRTLTWRGNLSVDRFTPDELLTQDLRQQRLEQQISISPLEEEYKRYQIVHMQAEVAKAQSDMRNETETQQERAAFFNGWPQLKNYLSTHGAPLGTHEHAEAVATYAAQFPLARSSADIQAELKTHATVADEQAALQQRIRTLAPAPEKIAERYARVQGDVATNEALLKGDIERQKKANSAANVPYNPAYDVPSATIAGNLAGAKAEKAQLEKEYPRFVQPVVQAPATQPQTQQIPLTPGSSPNPGQAINQNVSTSPTPTPIPPGNAAATQPTISARDQTMISWAAANPNDPLAARIREKHGLNDPVTP